MIKPFAFAIPLVLSSLPFVHALPERADFQQGETQPPGVPVDAFTLDPAVSEDLQLDVWATSPLLFSPVAMDVDAQNRVWLTEGLDYHIGKRTASGQSIIVVADTNNDGKADHSHVFVSEPKIRPAPLGIAVFDNIILLSATPDIIKYTDVDRNAIFDPTVDKREVFLTGFQGGKHDHTLHAVIGAPSGQWTFSFGNMGADIKTKDGRNYISGCYYGFPQAIGKKSWDGQVYVPGLAMRINRDGTGLTPMGENLRNSHDMFVTSFGDVFQSDNDDPTNARMSWLMEYGNMGYADIRDGSRSWEEVAKPWEEADASNKSKRFSSAHWRENYPGTTPPGTIYGAGSPTGNVYIEGAELGAEMQGRYLVCDMVRKQVMAVKPSHQGAHIDTGEVIPFLGLQSEEQKQHFLPTDVALGTDGALFLADFYNETSRRNVQVNGTIYRVRPKSAGAPKPPVVDFKSVKGQLAALANPAVNVRTHAAWLLTQQSPETALPQVLAWQEGQSNPYVKARATWVCAALGPAGQAAVAKALKDSDPQQRVLAYRALRHFNPEGLLALASTAASDSHPAVRREVALSLRDASFEDSKAIIAQLIVAWDGKDRWALEAIGTAAVAKEKEVYSQLIRPLLQKTPAAQWDEKARRLAWRFHTDEAIADLEKVIAAQSTAVDELRVLLSAWALWGSEEERVLREESMQRLAALPAFATDEYQLTFREYLARDIANPPPKTLTESYRIPAVLGAETKTSAPEVIAALSGDAARGEGKAGVCMVCHRIGGSGAPFGPNISQWGQQRTIQEIVNDIVNPADKIAHGYEKAVRLTKDKHVAEGIMTNYSWHAGSLKIKVLGGEVHKILFRRGGVKVQELKGHTWMPPASKMGLTDQDVRDIAEFLKTRK